MLLRATGASIVTSWGVRRDRRVCFEKARWPEMSPDILWFRAPAVCAAFRRGIERVLDLHDDPGRRQRPRVVVALRGNTSRSSSDLDALAQRPELRGAEVLSVELGSTVGARTAEEQIRLIYSADAFVGIHGAAFALVALMRPGSIAGTSHLISAPALYLAIVTVMLTVCCYVGHAALSIVSMFRRCTL